MKKTYRLETIGKCGRTTHKLFSTAAAICLLFGTTTSVLAQTAFEGKLNSVSITDAAGTNSPPTANFTYTQDGDTFIFDASGSSDLDGSITEYRWDFGDNSKATGSIASYKFPEGNHAVTLTIIDNNLGTSIVQQTIKYSTGIEDDFISETSSAYINISGGISISNGTAYGLKAWTRNYVYHSTSTGSSAQYVQADLQSTSSESSGVILRHTGTNGYLVEIDSLGRLTLTKLTGTARSSIGFFPKVKGLTFSKPHTVRVEVSGTTFHAYVDSIDAGTLSDSSYSGQYIGLSWNRGTSNSLQPADNFSGGSLQ